MVTYLIKNSFLVYKDQIYHQIKGVPQGGNASPLLADLTLSMLEFRYLKEAANRSVSLRSKLYRYMDDILMFYNDDEMPSKLRDIYPNSLTLEQANVSDTEAAFLDIHLKKQEEIVKA